MKKLKLLLSMCTILPYVANAAEIYNKNNSTLNFDGDYLIRHSYSKDNFNSHINLYLSGDTKISDRVDGYFLWENTIPLDKTENDTNNLYTRLAYVGIKVQDYYSVDYGRNYGVLYDISKWTSIPLLENEEFNYDDLDNFMTYRTNNVLTYRSMNIAGMIPGLNFAIQLQNKNEGSRYNTRSVAFQNGRGIGYSITYKINNFDIGASYSKSDRTQEQRLDKKGNNATEYNIGFRYKNNKIYLASYYKNMKNIHYIGKYNGFAQQTQGFETLAQYKLTNNITSSIQYVQDRIYNIPHNRNYKNFINLAGIYSFNKNLAVIIEYKINLIHKDNFTVRNKIMTDNITSATLKYYF